MTEEHEGGFIVAFETVDASTAAEQLPPILAMLSELSAAVTGVMLNSWLIPGFEFGTGLEGAGVF